LISISKKKIDGYENIGEYKFIGANTIYIKKSEASTKNEFLTGINENLEPEYKEYHELLGDEIADDKKSREALKEKLCRTAWAVYKLLFFSTAGSFSENRANIKLAIQELFLHSIFIELRFEESLLELGHAGVEIKETVLGHLWVNKMTIAKNATKNPMQEWIRQFNKELKTLKNLFSKK